MSALGNDAHELVLRPPEWFNDVSRITGLFSLLTIVYRNPISGRKEQSTLWARMNGRVMRDGHSMYARLSNLQTGTAAGIGNVFITYGWMAFTASQKRSRLVHTTWARLTVLVQIRDVDR